MFFIAGITGNVGGAAAKMLLEKKLKVRTLSRNPHKTLEWSEKGVEVLHGDLNDPVALSAALEGVTGAFILLPPGLGDKPDFEDDKAMITSLREALSRIELPRVVFLSSIGSEQSTGLGSITRTHLLETAMADLPISTAFIRAGSFLQNYMFSLKIAADTGVFNTYLTPTNHPVPMISTEDIGEEVSRLLIAGWEGKKIVELGSPFSPDDLANAMSEVLGRPVKASAIPRNEWRTSLEAWHMPPNEIRAFEETEDSFNSGWIHFGVPGTEPVAAKTTPTQVFEKARQFLGLPEPAAKTESWKERFTQASALYAQGKISVVSGEKQQANTFFLQAKNLYKDVKQDGTGVEQAKAEKRFNKIESGKYSARILLA
jgi:uncharacterized protein YbjT (DUF2867 family)